MNHNITYEQYNLDQLFCWEAMTQVPIHSTVSPELIPILWCVRVTKEFNFHLLKFSNPEGEVTGSNFITEAFANLSDPERNFDPWRIDDILEIDEENNSIKIEVDFWTFWTDPGLALSNDSSK